MSRPPGQRKPRSREEQLAALQQQLAVELVGQLCGLEQAGRLYDINNDMVSKLIEEMLATVTRFARGSGEPMVLTLVGYSVFVNRRLVRLDFADYRRAQHLKRFWENFGIGEIRFPEQTTRQGLTELVSLLFQAMGDPHMRPALFSRDPGGVKLMPTAGEDRPGERQDPHLFTIRVYCALLALTRKMEERVRAGKRPPMLRIKRTLQVVVDLLEGQESLVLALTRLPSFRNDLAGHLVGTAVVALALGRRLGLGRMDLMALGTAALLHDLPKAGLKDDALNQLEVPAAVPAEDRQRVEGLWLKVLRRVVDLGGFNEETLARLTVMFESQLEFARTDLYAASSGLSPYARIIAICDLYDTVAWRRAGKRQRTDHYAVMTVLQSAAGGQVPHLEPPLAAALLQTVGLYPVGSPLLLQTGEIAVVTGNETGDPERPEVHLVFDAQGRAVDGPELDLVQERSRQVLWPLALGPLGVNPAVCFIPKESDF